MNCRHISVANTGGNDPQFARGPNGTQAIAAGPAVHLRRRAHEDAGGRLIASGNAARTAGRHDDCRIAGINMRLTAGGARVPHWHKEAEWSFMLAGNARIKGA